MIEASRSSTNEKKAKIKQRLAMNQDVVDSMTKFLKKFSKHLRRDFLQILVRLTAKKFSLQTVRDDWRERKGMLAFLADRWTDLHNLILQDTFFNWYCYYFPTIESVLVVKKFVIFIYDNWDKYSDFFKRKDVIFFIHYNILDLEQILINPKITRFPELWSKFEVGTSLSNIIHEYRQATQIVPEQKNSTDISTSTSSADIVHHDHTDAYTAQPLQQQKEDNVISATSNNDNTIQPLQQQKEDNDICATSNSENHPNPEYQFPEIEVDIIGENTYDLFHIDCDYSDSILIDSVNEDSYLQQF